MKLVSQREDWDRVAALLSADWFLPHWHTIALSVETETRLKVCNGARTIVKNFMGTSQEYINIDFSERRLHETRDELLKLVEDQTGESVFTKLTAPDATDNTVLWLLDAITLQAIGESSSSPAATEELGSEARIAIAAAYTEAKVAEQSYSLEQASLKSNTPWDRQLRDWSPDQPTWLTDWMFARSFDGESFAIFWAALKPKLGRSEVGRIRGWYETQAIALADKDAKISLPSWMS